MNHLEKLAYDYCGFYEGEYLYRYFLPEKLQSDISPRDLLVVYWILRGFTPDMHPRLIMPSAFRYSDTLRQVETMSSARVIFQCLRQVYLPV